MEIHFDKKGIFCLSKAIKAIIKPIKHIIATSPGDEIHTDGNSPIKVIGDDYNMYVAKNSKNKKPATDIINELLAYYFLQLWEIPTPESAIIDFSPEMLLPEYTPAYHQPHYYKRPLFGSQWVNGIDCTSFIQVKSKPEYKTYHHPEIIFRIGLFDIWAENDDRKPTNNNLLIALRENKQHILPIDHAYLFGTVSYKNLDPANFAGYENDNIFLTPLALSLKPYKKAIPNWLEDDREFFYLCIERCKQYFEPIIQNIPASWGFDKVCSDTLYNFLFNQERNENVFNEYIYKMTL